MTRRNQSVGRRFWQFGRYVSLGLALVLLVGLAPAIATWPHTTQLAANPAPTRVAQSGATLLQQGRDRYQAGQFTAAAELWSQAAAAFQAAGDRGSQAQALTYLSLAYQKLGQLTQAETAINTSLKLLDGATDAAGRSRLAQARNTQGSLQLAQGNGTAALQTWNQAAQLYADLGDAEGQVGALINQSQAQQVLGNYLQARKTLMRVRQALQSVTDPQVRLLGLHNLGDTLRALGDLETAASVLQESLTLAQQTSKADTGAILLSLGNTARAQQQPHVALDYYQQAATATAAPLTRTQAQLNALRLLIGEQRWAEAQALQAQLQQPVMDLPASRPAVYAQINYAQSLAQLRRQPIASAPDWPAIARLMAQARQQAQQLGDVAAESYALGNLGGLYEQTGQWDEAIALTQTALLLAQTANAPDIAYQWQWQLGRLQRAQADQTADGTELYNRAIASYTEAVTTLQSLRNDLVAINSDVQFSFRESVEPVYRQLVSLLLSDRREVSQSDLEQARTVIESLQLAELENFFQEACLDAQPVQIDRIDPDAAVFYSIILEDRLEVILALPQQPLRRYASPIAQADMDRTLEQMRRAIRRTSPNEERLALSQKVYDLLIRPAERAIAASNVKTLVFILDGTLQNIPVAALHDGQQYLMEKYSIALSPGLQLLDPQALQREQLRVLIGGLSEASQGFAALPGVQQEVQQVQAQLPTEVLLNQTFTSYILQRQVTAAPFPVVHLATHGQFSSDVNQTFILAWDKPINVKQLDAILKSRGQGGDRTPIELLVLSACETAAGDKRAALGLAGVAVRSGARSTLATLWAVDDQSTAFLMEEFYRRLADSQTTKAEALHQAQIALSQQPGFQHPYYWAPFVLVGNWL